MLRRRKLVRGSFQLFQSSHAPRRGCCLDGSGLTTRRSKVSILTRAEARVLRIGAYLHPVCIVVSILTRAEARVLPYRILSAPASILFQSSPAPRRGCCARPEYCEYFVALFQSSPAPRRGCCFQPEHGDHRLGVSILTRAEARVLH